MGIIDCPAENYPWVTPGIPTFCCQANNESSDSFLGNCCVRNTASFTLIDGITTFPSVLYTATQDLPPKSAAVFAGTLTGLVSQSVETLTPFPLDTQSAYPKGVLTPTEDVGSDIVTRTIEPSSPYTYTTMSVAISTGSNAELQHNSDLPSPTADTYNVSDGSVTGAVTPSGSSTGSTIATTHTGDNNTPPQHGSGRQALMGSGATVGFVLGVTALVLLAGAVVVYRMRKRYLARARRLDARDDIRSTTMVPSRSSSKHLSPASLRTDFTWKDPTAKPPMAEAEPSHEDRTAVEGMLSASPKSEDGKSLPSASELYGSEGRWQPAVDSPFHGVHCTGHQPPPHPPPCMTTPTRMVDYKARVIQRSAPAKPLTASNLASISQRALNVIGDLSIKSSSANTSRRTSMWPR